MMDMNLYVAWRLYVAKHWDRRNMRIVDFVPVGLFVAYGDKPLVRMVDNVSRY